MEADPPDTSTNELSPVTIKTEFEDDTVTNVEVHSSDPFTVTMTHLRSRFGDRPDEHDSPHFHSSYASTVDEYGLLLPESVVETHLDEDKKPPPELLDYQAAAKSLPSRRSNKKRKRKHKGLHNRVKKYYCDICPYVTIYRHGIKNHMLKHGTDKPYECDQCEYKTKYSTALHRHQQMHDGTSKTYPCPFCDYVGHYYSYMKTHIRRKHTPQGPFECMYCSYDTVYKYDYQVHMKAHEITPTQQQVDTNTTQGDNESPTEKQRREHKNTCTLIQNDSSGKIFKCNYCEYTSYAAARVRNHAVMHDDNKPYKCKLCTFKSKHSTALRRHERYQHAEVLISKQVLSCNQCEFTTTDHVRLKTHNDRTHAVYSYKCIACMYRTADDMAYLDHIVTRHNMIHVKKTKVELSEKTFCKKNKTKNDDSDDPLSDVGNTRSKIIRKRSLNRVIYGCNHCYYKTIEIMKIVNHSMQTRHTGYKYLCECEFSTKDLHLFNIHLSTSCVHVQFNCVACNVVATNQQELDEHLKTHIKDEEPDSQVTDTNDEEIMQEEEIMTDTYMDTDCIVEARDFDVMRGLPTENETGKKRSYKCILCDYSTPTRHYLSNHLKEHSPPYNCRLCNHTTMYLSSLRRHVTMHSEGNFDFKCHLCDFATSQQLYLKLHMRKHSNKKQYKCDSCPYETSYRNCIIKHVKVHAKSAEEGADQLERKTFNCDNCEFQAISEGRIIKHCYKKHGIPLPPEFTNKCDYCDFCSKDKWKLKVHYGRSYLGNLIKCKMCDFDTEYKCQLRTHFSQHPDHCAANSGCSVPSGLACSSRHTGQAAPSENPTATEAAAIKYQFIDNHQVDYLEWNDIPVHENAAGEKRFKCPHCLFASKYKLGVRRHFQRHHIRNNKQYHCPNCPFVTTTEISLDRHNRASKSPDPLLCSRCTQFTSYYKCELAVHAKIHDKFTCATCDYSCNSKYILARHIMKCHENENDQ